MFSVGNRAMDSHRQNFIFRISKTINKQDRNSKVGKWSMRGQISLYFLHVQANKPTNFLLFLTILGSPSPLVSACSRICQGSSENFRNPPWISNLAPSLHSLKEIAVCVCFPPQRQIRALIFPQVNEMEGKIPGTQKEAWKYLMLDQILCLFLKERMGQSSSFFYLAT